MLARWYASRFPQRKIDKKQKRRPKTALAVEILEARDVPSINWVQSNSGAFAVSSAAQAVSLASNVTAGDAVIVSVAEWDSPSGSVSLSDNLGNSYTQIGNATSGDEHVSLWYALANSTGSLTVTVTPSATAYLTFDVAEYSGVEALDSSSTGTGTGTAPAADPIAVNQPGDLVVTAYTQGQTVLSSATVGGGGIPWMPMCLTAPAPKGWALAIWLIRAARQALRSC